MNDLKFINFKTLIDIGFWKEIYKLKLEKYKNNQSPINLVGYLRKDLNLESNCIVEYTETSFDDDQNLNNDIDIVSGTIIIFNNPKSFHDLDKIAYLNSVGKDWYKNLNNTNLDEISKRDLVRVYAICYLDLKKHVHKIWFSYPSFSYAPLNELHFSENLKKHYEMSKSTLYEEILKFEGREIKFLTLSNDTLVKFNFKNVTDLKSDLYVILADGCNTNLQVSNPYLRNLLSILNNVLEFSLDIFVLCFRNSWDESQIMKIRLNHLKNPETLENFQVVGWELNDKSRLASKKVNLKNSFDMETIAQNAIYLNLKLIKWNILPQIDLDTVFQKKCLIIGAGTLGCYVARGLMAWGIQNISFIDCGSVSFSNPVRQSLYSFKDAIDCKNKAQTAAESLKLINPKIITDYSSITIPMPGHVFDEREIKEVTENISEIDKFIKNCDVVFNLTDNRESRWLTTVISQHHNKICITTAIGFESFLVIRHGASTTTLDKINLKSRYVNGDMLGCYFCNDIVSLTDTMSDRSLDKQCTVTRPGIAMMAAGHAVELFVSLVEHSDGINCCATTQCNVTKEDDKISSCLGIVPHQIRCYLPEYKLIQPTTQRFNKCCACSPIIVDNYARESYTFVLKSILDPSHLNKITQLDKDLKIAENVNIDIDSSSTID
ncbi:Autophagy-related protein 7 [Intoshia linei]|uniref:Autophagy-related protein 7 n=1 Tax=Intoshia linei TaxID=1819745 RepID=A0A177BCN8_9BILA|nr:Autophagy-related protein 7 [Intoshia linei]